MATLYKNVTIDDKQYNLKYITAVKFSTVRAQVNSAQWWNNGKEAEKWASAADIDDLKFTHDEFEIPSGSEAGKKYNSYRTNGYDSKSKNNTRSDLTTNYAVGATLI
mgnify:CR=1 FL=1|jgi:uncharacterized protein (DUF2147 family)|tara:strand:+ start:621 stop:941 length:321 start_codon:yes stop_codon:yes gene_type:complete